MAKQNLFRKNSGSDAGSNSRSSIGPNIGSNNGPKMGVVSSGLCAVFLAMQVSGCDTDTLQEVQNNEVISDEELWETPLSAEDIAIQETLWEETRNYLVFTNNVVPGSDLWAHLESYKQQLAANGLNDRQVFAEMQNYINTHLETEPHAASRDPSSAAPELPAAARENFERVFRGVVNLHFSEGNTLDKANSMQDSIRQRMARRIASNFMLEEPRLPDQEELTDMMLEGMLGGLDRYSRYLTADQWETIRADKFSDEKAGLGIEIRRQSGDFFVYYIAPDSPAAQSGLQRGDVLNGIDEWNNQTKAWEYTSFEGLGFNAVLDLLAGENDTFIALHTERDGQDRVVEMQRDMVRNNPLEVACVDNQFTHIRLRTFTSNAHEILDETVSNIEDYGGCATTTHYYLDLRDNTGGSLTSALGISDSFLDSGLIFFDDRAGSEHDTIYRASEGGVFQGERANPDSGLTVMINGNSASASEIVADRKSVV